MAVRNQEVVNQLTEAFAHGELDIIPTLLADDVTYRIPGSNRLSGKHRGIEAVMALLQAAQQQSGDKPRHEQVMEVSVGEQHVATRLMVEAFDGDRRLNWRQNMVYLFHEGKVVGCWVFVDNLKAFDAFWNS
jgi:ketosteroid isomerase-like protein